MEFVFAAFVFAALAALVVCFVISLERRTIRQREQLAKLTDDIATLRANMLYKSERNAVALTAVAEKLSQVEQLAKRRTRR